jgi:hypothetical protein
VFRGDRCGDSSRSASFGRGPPGKRHGGPTIRVRAADQGIGFLVGALLHDAIRGSEGIADAFVVATCAPFEAALVITSDPTDISVLASHLPGVRVALRRPDLRGH